jgi:hypothetical protein
LNKAKEAANLGLKDYELFWGALPKSMRAELLPEHDALKKLAADRSAANQDKASA